MLKKEKTIAGMPERPIVPGSPAVIRESTGFRHTSPVLWVDQLSPQEITFETRNTLYHLRVVSLVPERGAGRVKPQSVPPYVEVVLPGGVRLTAVAFQQDDYPGINLYLRRAGKPDTLICFAEFNRERKPKEQVCVGVYQPGAEDTVYYAPYRAEQE